MKSLGFLWGVVLIVLGSALLAWVAYNQFVEMQPAAAGRSPVVSTVLGLLTVGAGVWRVKRQLDAER